MRPLVIANWKANLTTKEASEWLRQGQKLLEEVEKVTIVICPTFVTLPQVASSLKETSLFVGAQNVSPFPHGKYTGEVPVEILDGLVRYCLVGHSERRAYFGETNQLISTKVKLLESYRIKPVVCVENIQQAEELSDQIKTRDLVVAYEPTFAIGTGTPDTPKNAGAVAEKIKHFFGSGTPVLYGGSVTPDNALSFAQVEVLNGTLVGGSSLNPHHFVEIVKAYSKI